MEDRTAAITRRLSELLAKKRDKLQFYRLVLENLCAAVDDDRMDKVAVYTEMSGSLTKELEAIQSALTPLEALYHTAYPGGGEDQDIVTLSGEVLLLQAQVRKCIDDNCRLLKARMESIKGELSGLRVPRERRGLFDGDTARRFDISF